MSGRARYAVACACLVLVAAGVIAQAARASASFVRVNQVGYPSGGPKEALLMSSAQARRARFELVSAAGRVVFRGRAGLDQGHWSARFGHVTALDFGKYGRPGRYRIVVPALHARSPLFRIAPGGVLYARAAANAVRFFHAQRDGAVAAGGPLQRQSAHLNDRSATVFAQPTAAGLRGGRFVKQGGAADVSGGWFDAGDYLKFAETASFSDTLLLWSERDHPGRIPGLAAEARVGIDWLERMYDPQQRVLLYQVGLGDGTRSGSLLGDHDLWRLPQRDDALRSHAARFLAHRPVFAAGPGGAPLSPNLAGRMAAAFGLCAQVYRASDPAYADRCLSYGEAIYAQAKTTGVGTLLTASPHSYYPEASWRDDMALGAVELYKALAAAPNRAAFAQSDPVYYLDAAGHWADAYSSGAGADQDSLNLYDVEALADYDLAHALANPPQATDVPTDPHALARDLRDQLRIGARVSQRYPFRLANPNTWADSVTHALGYSVSARLYDSLTHTRTYAALAQHQLDWVLGANAWGSSFVVGSGTTFPQCLQHQVANLAGNLHGRSPLLLGATVAGPAAAGDARVLGAPDGYRRCSRSFARFDGRGAVYRDDVRSAATSEPSDDATALALLAFSGQL